MKNIILKINTTLFYIILLVTGCKENKIDKVDNTVYDKPSLDEMITNYQMVTEGDFRFTANEYLNTDLTKYVETGGFGGVIYDSITPNFNNLTKIKLGKIIMNEQEIPFHTVTNYYGGTQEQLTNFFPYLFDNKPINIKIYDKNDIDLVVEFNYKSPKILQTKIEDGYLVDITTAQLPSKYLYWNKDPNNIIGIVVVVNVDGYNKEYIPLADDGKEPLSNIIKDYKGFVLIRIYRGSILVKEGTDKRKYKITNVAESYCSINVD